MATRPIVNNLPPAPLPTDSIEVFDSKAFDHVAALDQFVGEVNDVAEYVNSEADRANTRANASASSATASANSATRSDEWANKAPGSVVASGKYSARHYSDLSDKFANAPEDVEVEPGKFSALHWQEKAKKIANVHATTVATDPLPTVLATNVQEALRDLAYQSDQLRVAKNQLKYGDGPYPDLDFQFQGANMLDPRIEFTRSSKDWDEYGNEYGIDVPVLTDKGLWVSGTRTSLQVYSNDLMQSSGWTNLQNGTITQSPYKILSGLVSLFNLEPLSVGSYAVIDGHNFSLLENTDYVLSLFVKRTQGARVVIRLRDLTGGVSHSVDVDLDSLEVSGLAVGGIVHVEGDVYRLWAVVNSRQGSGVPRFRVSVRTSEEGPVPVGGANIVEGTTLTSYIPTEGSQVTVALTRAITQRLPFSTSGAFTFSSLCPSYQYINTLIGSGSSNGEEVRFSLLASRSPGLTLRTDGVNVSIRTTGEILEIGKVFKGAFSFEVQANGSVGFKLFVNGLLIGEHTLSRMPIGFLTEGTAIGSRRVNHNSLHWGESISSITYFNKALTDEQLQELTTL